MKSESQTLTETSLVRFRCCALALQLFALVLVCFSGLDAFAQSQTSRKLTLITPEDTSFEQLLSSNYAGIQDHDAYQTVRPFLVLLRNDTAHPVEAYSVMWEVRVLDGHTIRLQNHYIQKHFSPRSELRPLKPGELRLLAPSFNLSPDQYNVQHEYVAKLLTSVASSSAVFSQRRFTSVTPSVDAVIYDDGAVAGADHFKLSLRYQCLRDAERDVASSAVELLDANTPAKDVLDRLRQDVEHGRAVKPSPSHRDRATLYALYRGKEAQHLLTVYKSGGDRALRQRAEFITHSPRKTLTPLPPESSK